MLAHQNNVGEGWQSAAAWTLAIAWISLAAGKGQNGSKQIPKFYQFRGCCFCSKHLLGTYCVHALAYSGCPWGKNEMQSHQLPSSSQLTHSSYRDLLLCRHMVLSLPQGHLQCPLLGMLSPTLSPKEPPLERFFSESPSTVANPHPSLSNPWPPFIYHIYLSPVEITIFICLLVYCLCPLPQECQLHEGRNFSVGSPAPARCLEHSRCSVNICLTNGKQ